MSSSHHDNPAYNGDTQKDDQEINVGESHGAETGSKHIDMNFLVSSLDQLTTDIVYHNIDKNSIDLNRLQTDTDTKHGPGTSTDDDSSHLLKIASLEGYGDLKENKDYVQLFRSVIGEAPTSKERRERANESLINYFSLLGSGQENTIDYEFVESLTNIADLNSRDIHGQSIMHELAREWSTSVAMLLFSKGMNIDLEDNFGRTPLFVAVAANYVVMINWLIDNGANIKHQTIAGEGQYAVHYAGKCNSVEAFGALIKRGADPLERDNQNRTPFYVAAKAGHTQICKYMLNMDLPTATYADNGEATIDLILDRLPNNLGLQALDQFISPAAVAGQVHIHLSCLGKRRWKLLAKQQDVPLACKTEPPGPVDVITSHLDLNLIKHPVIVCLIKEKSKYFASKYIHLNSFLHLLFTLLWTCAVSVFKEEEAWFSSTGILVLTIISQIMTIVFIIKFYIDYRHEYMSQMDERDRVLGECNCEERYCHPRWIIDKLMLSKNREIAENIKFQGFKDGWIFIEILCLVMATGETIITILYVGWCDTSCVQEGGGKHSYAHTIKQTRKYYSVIFILLVWIRLNICFRYHQQLGPFISMLGGCVSALAQIGFLFGEFFIPFVITCWTVFGGTIKTPGKKSEYSHFNNMVYQLYLLSFVGDYDYDTLRDIANLPSQVFVGMYALVVSVITINIYIALLSEGYASIMESASASSYLQQALQILSYERILVNEKHDFEVYLNKQCAPMIADEYLVAGDSAGGSARTIIQEASAKVLNITAEMKTIIEEQAMMKKDVSTTETKFREFNGSHTPEAVNIMRIQFNDILRNEKKLFVKLTKRTEEQIGKFKKKLKDLYIEKN